MKFCTKCGRAIKKRIISGLVTFICVCENVEKTNPEDLLINNVTTTNTETIEMYETLIKVAPYDRTNQLVKEDCPNCGLDYLAQVRIGTSETIIYVCDCGYEKS